MNAPAVATAPSDTRTSSDAARQSSSPSVAKQQTHIIEKLPSAAYDNKIYAKFSAKTIEKKAVNKEEFQKEFGLIPEKKALLLGFCLPLTEKNGAEALVDILPGIEATGVQIAIMGIGTARYQEIITDFAMDNEGHVAILENSDENVRKLNAAADCMLFFDGRKEAEQAVLNAFAYGAVPLANEKAFPDLIQDYNPNQEKGNAFVFPTNNQWHVFAALVRAIENYKFPYDWKNIAKEGMNMV